MQKIQKHIEIIRSVTATRTSLAKESCDAIYAVLKQHYEVVGVSIVNSLSDLELLVSKQPDLVFMGMKFLPNAKSTDGRRGQRVWVSTYLDQHGIDHTGSGQEATEFEVNKPLAKQRVLDVGIKTSPFVVIKTDETYPMSELPLRFPLFAKPTNLGGGRGIDHDSVIHSLPDLRAKVRSIADRHSSNVLVEEYLPGREFSVGILKDEYSGELIAMPIELVTTGNSRGDRILSKAVKSSNEETVLAVTDLEIRAQVVELAAGVFNALGARYYGRIDIRLDKGGTPHFLEANLMPSLISGYGSFPKACLINIGMDHKEMILSIVRLGLSNSPDTDIEAEETEPALGGLLSATV